MQGYITGKFDDNEEINESQLPLAIELITMCAALTMQKFDTSYLVSKKEPRLSFSAHPLMIKNEPIIIVPFDMA